MDPRYIQALLTEDVRRCIGGLSQEDPYAVALAPGPIAGLPPKAVAEQVACRRKAERKLPTISRGPFLYDRTALEQCSSEATARYKARLLRGRRAIDMTGGLGIDAMYLAEVFEEVVYCEANGDLVELFRANAALRRLDNVRIHAGDSLDTLSRFADDSFDWIYVDPSRRPGGRRTVSLDKSEPDVVACRALLLRKAPRVCVKSSPLLEPRRAAEKLPHIQAVEVVSVEGECRELLLLQNRARPPQADIAVRAVLLGRTGECRYAVEGTLSGATGPRPAGPLGSWFYDPDPAIVKSRLSTEVAARLGLSFLNDRVDYMTSQEMVSRFPGRAFRVLEAIPWSRRRLGAYLRSRRIDRAVVARRDFPMTPEQIREMLGLGEGAEEYLFFTRDAAGRRICIHCRRHRPETRGDGE